VASSIIAKRRGLPALTCEETFVGGLLHDIGKLFLDQFFAEQYSIAMRLATAANIEILHAEDAALGTDHAVVGKRIATNWRLPQSSTTMISDHHQPKLSGDYFDCVATVHTADIVVRHLGLGLCGDAVEPQLEPHVDKWLAFAPEDWEFVLTQTVERFEKAKEFVSVLEA